MSIHSPSSYLSLTHTHAHTHSLSFYHTHKCTKPTRERMCACVKYSIVEQVELRKAELQRLEFTTERKKLRRLWKKSKSRYELVFSLSQPDEFHPVEKFIWLKFSTYWKVSWLKITQLKGWKEMDWNFGWFLSLSRKLLCQPTFCCSRAS